MKLFRLAMLGIIVSSAVFFSCEKEENLNGGVITNTGNNNKPGNGDNGQTGTDDKITIPTNPDAVPYSSLRDPLSDAGQFYLPYSKIQPEAHWTLVYTDYADRQNPNKDGEKTGLQNHLLMNSIAGLVNRACEEGKTKHVVWIEKSGTAYNAEKDKLGKEIGRQNAIEMATKTYNYQGSDATIKKLFDGYVLTDLRNNPESGNIATVASHVYNSIIVDVRDSAFFNNSGYEMKCDCSKMTLSQAFDQFKDKCNNNALVVMPVQTGELREYAIKNKLFVFNLNKYYNDPDRGQNLELFDRILDWMKPNSQVLGWEKGVGEDVFTNKVSKHGHLMLASDWSYNVALTSRNYKDRQPDIVVKTINPKNIDYNLKKSFCSFFLTDGDNYQFIIEDNFETNYYRLSTSADTKMAFELGTQSLIQLAPDRFKYLIERQPSEHCTIMETFGGGYYYVDTYSTEGTSASKRAENLKIIAERTAAHMRQHGIKILHVIAMDLKSSRTKEALQAFVDANDQLEGIVAIQYNPYDAGGGDVIWVTNKAGYDIPCLTAKYKLWDGFTTPESIAAELKNNSTIGSCTAVVVHAWSTFNGKRAADAVALCQESLPSAISLVSMQELIWRLRMKERKEQTIKYLSTIK